MKASIYIAGLDDEKGMAMAIAMLMVLIFSIIIVSLMATAKYTIYFARNESTNVKAFYLAEAGIARAKSALKGANFSSVLVGADGIANTSDDGILNFGPTVSLGSGTYSVKVTDNDDGDNNYLKDADHKVVVTSQGTSQGVTRSTRILATSLIFPAHAVVCGGDLNFAGGASIQGSVGHVHANDDLIIGNNPVIAGNATASGNYLVTGGPTIGGVSGGGFPQAYIPPVDPEKYRPMADYELMSNGKVYDSSGNCVAFGNFKGWTWSSLSNWTSSGESGMYSGTYYIEGKANIAGNPGTPEFPWRVTVIASKSIYTFGTPIMRSNSGSDVLFVAGTDLSIVGNADQKYEGLMLAHEQLYFSGNPVCNGAIVIEDAENIDNTVNSNSITGGMSLTYNGSLHAISDKITVLNWHEVTHNSSS